MKPIFLFAAILFFTTAYYYLPGLEFDNSLAQSVMLALGLFALLYWIRLSKVPQVDASLDKRGAALAALLTSPFIFYGFIVNNHAAHGIGLGTQPGYAYLALLCFGSVTLVVSLVAAKVGAKAFCICGVALGLLLQVAAILSFPPGSFSDMLPLIQATGAAFLKGQPAYGQHLVLGHLLYSTHLPLTWMAYLPAVALKTDLRWINLAYLALFARLVWRLASHEQRDWTASLLFVFFTNPWLSFRNDLYLWPHFCCLALWANAVKDQKLFWADLFLGLSAASYQLSWPLLPLWLVYRFKKSGGLAAIQSFLFWLILLLGFLGPFCFPSCANFVQGVFLHWKGAIEFTALNLVYWLRSIPALICLQFLFCLAGSLWLWRVPANPYNLFGACSAMLALFLAANYHVEHYFYFLPAGLLLFQQSLRSFTKI